MEVHSAWLIDFGALVLGGLVASAALAEPPSPTPESATLAGTTFATLTGVQPAPLRSHVAPSGVEVEAFELKPGRYRVSVEYEELGKEKVEGFESRETRTPPLEGSRRRSQCAFEFDFAAGKLYRVVRSGLAGNGKLKRFGSDNWGVWLIAEEWNLPLAQCL